MKRFILLLPLLLSAAAAFSDSPCETRAEITSDNREQVVLLHGLGRSRSAMWWLAGKLEDAGFQVSRIGYSSLTRSPDEIIAEISAKITACCAGNPKPVHFVGHSLGGLLIRAFLQDNQVEHLGRVVLLGTPNQGTELVDLYREHALFSLLGPTTAALGTHEQSLPKRLESPDYPVGVIAAVAAPERDNADIPGPDDGLVSVASTRLQGMSDFIEVSSGHSMMRYNTDVVRQTIAFLRSGQFVH